MASYYRQKRSPYFWKRVQNPDGTWKGVKSNVRVDAKNAIRLIKQEVAEDTAWESMSEGRSESRWECWVPQFLQTHYETSPLTLQRYLLAWSALEVYLEIKKISTPADLSFKHCYDYPAWRSDPKLEVMKPCNWNTALTEIKIMGPVMQHAIYAGWVKANPCVRLGLGRRNVKRKPVIKPEEEKLIEEKLKKAPKYMQEMWLVAMRQGVRLRETGVPMERINLKLNTISVIGKGGKIHTGPLHKDLLPMVKKAIKEKKKFLIDMPKHPSKCWSQWFRKIGLRHISFHSTRRTVITKLAAAGYSRHETKAYVGHSSETSHEIYVALEAANVGHLGSVLGASSCNPSDETPDSSAARLKRPSRLKPRQAS